jgi:O-antigen/teichoic acid export membrane protein
MSNLQTEVAAPFSLRKVFKGASIYGLGEVLVKASGFFLIPIYTRVLTPADYGIVGYLQVFLQIATVIVAFGAHGAQTRYYYENSADSEMMGRFAFTINLVPVAFALVVGLPIAVFGSMFGWTVGSAQIPFSPYMVLTLWTVVLQVLANNAVSW